MAITKRYVDGPFGQIHVAEAGPQRETHRVPLVCFHQSPISGAQFALFQREMATDRRVLCPDTPGFGNSDGPDLLPTIEDYAEALATALDQLGFSGNRQVDVLGFHTGTQICIEIAAARPDLVRRVVVSSLALFTPQELERNRAGFGGPRPLFTDREYVGDYFEAQVTNGLEDISPERRLELFSERLRSGTDSWYGPEAVFAYDTAARLKDVTQPVLLYVMRDTLSENTRRAASLLAHSSTQDRLDIHGPSGWDSHPADIAADIRRFLDASSPLR